MTQRDDSIEERLLAYHMGWLSRTDRAELERMLESDPALASRSRTLARSLSPLDDWQALPAVEHLEDQVLRRIRREHPEPSVAGEARLDGGGSRLQLPRLIFSFKEVLAVAACIALLLTVVVPGFARSSAVAQRRVCADHLRQVGIALGSYVQDHAFLPFAGPAQGNWLREPTAGVPRLRNSRHRFLLLSEAYLPDAKAYVCPADRDGVVMRFENPHAFEDFAEPRNCSYDSQIMLGGSQADDPDLVVFSDSNPLFDGASRPGSDPAELNSAVHRGLSGQNVLRLVGAVAWESSPNVGVQNDNIWQIGSRLNYTGSERPQFATDSFMIP